MAGVAQLMVGHPFDTIKVGLCTAVVRHVHSRCAPFAAATPASCSSSSGGVGCQGC
jgi:hypothetical protein